MFLLLGFLLVIGFLAIAALYVQIAGLEERGARGQRDEMLTPLGTLVTGFDRAVRDTVVLGQTDVGDFVERTRESEERIRSAAARGGVYLEIGLDETPDPAYVSARCGAWDSELSAGGVIVGYDVASRKETIVGAVYDVAATDGRETLRFPHFVQAFDCLAGSVKAFFDGWSVTDGNLDDLPAGQNDTDGDAAMNMTEEGNGTALTPDTVAADSATLDSYRWNSPEYIYADDSIFSSHSSTPNDDFLTTMLAASAIPDGTIIADLRLRVDAKSESIVDDYLQLRVHDGVNVLHTFVMETPATESTSYYDLTNDPDGNGQWTKAEIGMLVLEVKQIEINGFDPSGKFHIDFINAELHYQEFVRHGAAVEFTWTDVLDFYEQHTLLLRYKYAGTEGFELQVWDGAAFNTCANLPDTAGAWAEVSCFLDPGEVIDAEVRARIRDASATDGAVTEGDVLYIDYLLLQSTFIP